MGLLALVTAGGLLVRLVTGSTVAPTPVLVLGTAWMLVLGIVLIVLYYGIANDGQDWNQIAWHHWPGRDITDRGCGLLWIAQFGPQPISFDCPTSARVDRSGGVTVNISSAVIQSARASDTDIAQIVLQALQRITPLLPGLDARVNVGVDPNGAIREVGVVGRSDPNTGEVTIVLDPAFQDFATTLRVWLPVTLAYELDHAQRINSGPGVGHTLLDAMVFEGVADAFSIQAFPQAPPIPWDHALSPTEEKAAWRQAKGKLNLLLDMSEYRSWFFGTGPLPRWTGYTLGFRIVSEFLDRHPQETAASITSLSAARILQGSGLHARSNG